MFPIKYIENNLVFNHDGECFAYYELTPYNYSFLSPEEKYMVHDNFRQLIAQNRFCRCRWGGTRRPGSGSPETVQLSEKRLR